MYKNRKKIVIVTGALLMALFLMGALVTGISQAQSGQSTVPRPGWRYGMMGGGMMGGGMMGGGMMGGGMMGHGMMGHGMMGYALGNSATVTDTKYASPVSVPESFVAALGSADPNRGQQLTAANACFGCHSLDPNQMMAGPTWHDLAETAATRVAGQTAAEYLYASIIHSNAYVVSGYQPSVMIQRYGQTLSEQDVADIVKYLLTLDGER